MIDQEHMNRQKGFSATVSILISMRSRSLISSRDYETAYGILVEKYNPFYHIIVDNKKK